MRWYLIQENGRNVATLALTEGMAGCWPITALSDYVEAEGFARYDEYTFDTHNYLIANTDEYCEAVYCNGYASASLMALTTGRN